MPNEPEYIIWHTAAHGSGGVDYDTSADQIDRWHKDRGWAGIGYHFVIRKGGQVEAGRPPEEPGAHALGLNRRSLGLCFSGHGDIAPHTVPQRETGLALTRQLMERYQIPAARVLGHGEINSLVQSGALDPRYMTSKSCPGRLVNMNQVRQVLAGGEDVDLTGYQDAAAGVLLRALQDIYESVEAMGLAGALDELNAFRRQPEVDACIARYRDEHGL